jgi:hypothetical protein
MAIRDPVANRSRRRCRSCPVHCVIYFTGHRDLSVLFPCDPMKVRSSSLNCPLNFLKRCENPSARRHDPYQTPIAKRPRVRIVNNLAFTGSSEPPF